MKERMFFNSAFLPIAKSFVALDRLLYSLSISANKAEISMCCTITILLSVVLLNRIQRNTLHNHINQCMDQIVCRKPRFLLRSYQTLPPSPPFSLQGYREGKSFLLILRSFLDNNLYFAEFVSSKELFYKDSFFSASPLLQRLCLCILS